MNAKNGSITSLFSHKFAVLAAASLAAIWIEHQADSLFKFLESTLLPGTAPSDDSASHVAQFTHDVASLDTAIMQAIRDVELGAHRIDLSSSSVPATLQNGNDEGNGLPAPVNPGNVVFTNGVGENSVNLAAPSTVPANDHLAASHSNPVASDTDSAASATNLLLITSAKEITPAVMASSQLAPTAQPAPSVNPIVATSEAVVQLATSDIVSPSIQPVVLSSGAVPLNLALEQASAQVGLDANLPQSSTVAPSDPVSNPTSPVASASINQIMRAVEAFLHDTPSFEITVSGSNVVIIDTKLSDASSPDFGVRTWDLYNGSTLSIVGIIPHHHAPATA